MIEVMAMERVVLPRPTLVLGCGIASSGKTTILNEVARVVIDSFWIDKDTLNEAFLHDRNGNCIEGSITSDYYHDYVKNQSYAYMLKEALINIRLGKTPIVEGNYNRQIRGGYLESVVIPLFAQEACAIKIVYCYAPQQIIPDSILARAALRARTSTKIRRRLKDSLRINRVCR
jgi:predicted kinase